MDPVSGAKRIAFPYVLVVRRAESLHNVVMSKQVVPKRRETISLKGKPERKIKPDGPEHQPDLVLLQSPDHLLDLLGPGVLARRQERYLRGIAKIQRIVQVAVRGLKEKLARMGLLAYPAELLITIRVEKVNIANRGAEAPVPIGLDDCNLDREGCEGGKANSTCQAGSESARRLDKPGQNDEPRQRNGAQSTCPKARLKTPRPSAHGGRTKGYRWTGAVDERKARCRRPASPKAPAEAGPRSDKLRAYSRTRVDSI